MIINEDLEKDHKFNVEAYLNEILDKEFFDFWMEGMEECGHIIVMGDGVSSHQGVAGVRRAVERIWVRGLGTWNLAFQFIGSQPN